MRHCCGEYHAETAVTCRYLLAEHPRAVIVLGNKTGCREIRRQLAEICPNADIREVAEDMSTLQARERYWQDYPPRGLQRFLPRGMRMPSRPLDDYAAVVLAERFLAGRREAETTG